MLCTSSTGSLKKMEPWRIPTCLLSSHFPDLHHTMPPAHSGTNSPGKYVSETHWETKDAFEGWAK